MKPFGRWLLIFSLALNALLLVWAGMTRFASAASDPRLGPAPSPTAVVRSHTSSAELAAAFQAGPGSELKNLVRRAQEAGFPAEVVQAIVRAAVHREFAERRARLWRATPYWKPADMAAIYDLDAQEQRRVRAIMGSAGVEAPDEHAQRERLYGRIPPEKIEQVEKLARDYDELVAKFNRENADNFGEDQRAALRLMREERERDLAALLTPEELDDLVARRSEASTAVMQVASAFEMSEVEFRALVAAEEHFNARLDPLAPDLSGPRKYVEAKDAQLAEIRRVLGPERFEKYLEATEPVYRFAKAFVQNSGLPSATTVALWQIDRDSNTRAGEICRQLEHDAPARNAALAKLREENRQSALALLTPAQLEAFHRRGGAMWLTLPSSP